MHVGFLCSEYPPGPHGGVGSVTQTLARGLVRRGHRVTVIGQYQRRSGEEADEGVGVLRLPAPSRSPIAALTGARSLWRAVRSLHREDPFDVLDGPELSYGGLTGALDVPRVLRMHGGHHFFSVADGRQPRRGRGMFERRSFAKATDLAAVSHYVADTTRSLLNLDRGREIEVIPNPVDAGRFRPLGDAEEDPSLVLFVGTLCQKKGVRQLVEAWPEVLRQHPSARLVLAGRDTTSDIGTSFKSFLADTATRLGVRGSMEFAGSVPNDALPSLLARAAVCIYPSHMEACPVAWLEGMSAGRAIVVSYTGPGPELVDHEVSGLLCDPHDPSSIAKSISRLLEDPELRRRLGVAARQRVLRDFSVEALLPVNEAFFAMCADR